jgi:hypothetical protein
MQMRAKYVTLRHASAVGVADRYRKSYYDDKNGWRTGMLWGEPEKIYEQLCELGPVPDIAAVAKIIGNKSWSYISCDGCSTEVETVVSIGGEWVEKKGYCSTCIHEAAAILKEESDTQ